MGPLLQTLLATLNESKYAYLCLYVYSIYMCPTNMRNISEKDVTNVWKISEKYVKHVLKFYEND